MKKILILLCGVVLAGAVQARTPELQFGTDGQFKIAQFTDMHVDLGTEYRRGEALKTLAQLDYILSAEKPDLVVFTGDIVTGKPAAEAWKMVLDGVKKYDIPFVVTLGNHDPEQDLTRAQIGHVVSSYPQSLNVLKADGQLDDMTLEVHGAKGVAHVIYCLDSHDYSTIEGLDGYGWFYPEQVAWYRARSAAYTAANGGEPLPALAFFHIALPEYVAAWRDRENTHIGRRAEDECPSVLNTGMFAAMKECGDVMGVFVGHDHDIDYVVAEKGIALGYGRFSGDHTTYHHLIPGVRLLTLREGERGFETWIRERDGRVVDHVTFGDGKISKVKK